MSTFLTGLALALVTGAAAGPQVLTLDEALARARRANAELPVAALDSSIAQQKLREARAKRRTILSSDGELWVAPANGYDPVVTDQGDERLQVVAERTVYDGGGLAAQQRQARADVDVAAARYRRAVADVEQQVREAFATLLASRREIAQRREGVERLERYLDLLQERSRSGQPLTGDLLTTRVQLAGEQGALLDARSRAEEARASLAVLVGLPPGSPLELAPLPPPAAPAGEEAAATEPAPTAGAMPGPSPATGAGEELPAGAFAGLPDIAAARAGTDSAAAALAAARAERAPQVTLRADAGIWGSDPLHPVPDEYAAGHPGATFADRLQRDLGYSLTVAVHLPLFDTGGVDARIAQAELGLEQARRELAAARVQAGLELSQARRALADAYDRYRLLSDAVPVARDAYLDVESRYWGGAATAREVLDAFAAAVSAGVDATQAELAYRMAEARLLRWGGGAS